MNGQIVDLFAGGGGASTGIELALGRSPDVAINHDPEALAMHAANHPTTFHLTENVWKADPFAVTRGKPVDLLWLSPDCRHHSKAKGGAPVSRSVRSLADVALYWAKVSKPDVIALENVEEWRDWGPLDEEGRPCKVRKGEEFFRWVRTLESMGYEVDWMELRACDYGAPTIRKRLFLIARRDGFPILRPEPTHGNPKSEEVKTGKLKPWRTAAEIIDWSLPCPSIFLTRENAKEQGLKVIRPLAAKTLSRIARGFKRYVLDRPEPFIVAVAHGDSGGRREYPIGEPWGTVTKEQDRALVTPFVSYAQQGGANRAADEPLHTVCASTKDQNQIIVPHLMTMRNSGKPFQGADEPTHTVTAGGAGLCEVAAFLAQHNGNGVIGRDAEEPLSTITTTAANQQPVFAYLAGVGGRMGQSGERPVDAPYHTVCTKPDTVVVLPHLSAYYGTGEGAATDEPARTVTTHDRFAHVEGAARTPPLADWQVERARAVADFLRSEGVWTGGEFVTVGPFIVWDIGMRMLTPRELARAQGFPDSYILAAPLPGGGTLTETAQRHKIGNSVSPYPAAALIHANCVVAKTMPKKRRRLVQQPDPVSLPAGTNFGLFDGAAA